MKRGGVKISCNDTPRKKFEKTLKKIWKGREKRFIFASAFASRKGRGWRREKKSSLKYWREQNNVASVNRRTTRVVIHETHDPCRNKISEINYYNEEFDPGSGWTLATGLTHASRGAAGSSNTSPATGARVSNTCATNPVPGDNPRKRGLTPHDTSRSHGLDFKS